jgi:hypothetical protein
MSSLVDAASVDACSACTLAVSNETAERRRQRRKLEMEYINYTKHSMGLPQSCTDGSL